LRRGRWLAELLAELECSCIDATIEHFRHRPTQTTMNGVIARCTHQI
jgi:hypothetical protein